MGSYRSLVIGAGHIGAFYDSPTDRRTLTHSHAYANHPRVELCGIMDLDADRGADAAARWSTASYTSLSEALDAVQPQIVSICTPTDTHVPVVEEVVAVHPAFVFMEKPLGSRPGDAERISALLGEKGIPCMVNYPRTFDPHVQGAAKAARTGEHGDFITGAAYYSKGLRNNGSHLISLVQQVLGPISGWEVLDSRVDSAESDPSLDVFLRLERGGTFHMIPVDERAYSITDMTFFFRDARIHFRNFGLEVCVSRRRVDPVFPGYWDLEDQGDYIETGLGKSTDFAVSQIVRFLDDGSPFDGDLASAVRTEHVIDDICRWGELDE